ncbi:hypothetical protein HPB52_002241 [Rhipicephalus sanguineus]|uniref:Endonuclease/exonuclease/phosphatase domain-containing protein n=1 Tax=Rhipicephalus sanguineus TaxID=34632 RepID=A0A9D4T2J0_RHISA|nr:hypothetical protein HPB52_002241 [Rhipicephalus sanguineus]
MDVQTEGEDSYPATCKPSEWTPIISAYKGGQLSPETQVVPSQSDPVSAKPTASAVEAPANAVPASLKPSYRARQQHLRAAHAVALRDNRRTSRPAQAIGSPNDHLPIAAYIAPPPSAVRGVISQAYWEETSEQMLQDLQTRNPDADIAARRMGRTLSILITFAHGPVPHTIRNMSVVHRCTQYKGSLDACTNCRRPGHRYDVCPHPKSGLCSRCGDKHERQDVPSSPHGHRIVQGEKSHRQTTQPTASEDKVLYEGGLSPLDKSNPSTSAWSSGATRPNGTTSQDSEVKALREEVKQLRAALSTSSPTLPQISPPPSLPTLSDQPPQKKRRPDESPAQPIDFEAKFQDLAKNLEARFTERITAQSIQLLPPILKSAVRLAASNPLLIIGDFNCAHVDWGYRRTNHSGTVLYNEALMLQLTIFNYFSLPTRIGNSVTADTSPDLTLGRNIADLQWERTQTTLGSDHHLIRIAVNYQRPRSKFNVRRVKWDQLRKLRQARPTQAPFDFASWVRQLQEDIRQLTQTLDTTPKIPVIDRHP